MKAFSERNPVIIAVVGIVVLALIGFGTFYARSLPIIGGGSTYTADFAEASGLKTNDDVRIAGVKVGQVTSISLQGAQVRVQFQAKDAWIGDESTAAIKIKTLLGQEYVEIDPLGDQKLNPSTPIPVKNTTTPTDVTAALDGLSNTVGAINTTQLAQSFDTLSSAFADSPKAVRASLQGLTALSKTISSRDDELRSLAANTNSLTGTVAASNAQFTTLINTGAQLLQELDARSAAITQLLQGTRDLATQVSGLVADNSRTLAPALAQLTQVTTILDRNRGNLSNALKALAPYYTLINNAAGSGPWIDIFLCGLFDSKDSPVIDSTALRNCNPKAGS